MHAREVKYRAYVKSLQKMYTVRTLRIDNDGVRMLYLSDPNDGEYGNGRGLSIDDFADVELMQYIGIKDKYGTDIYEGDILFLGLGNHRLEVRYCVVGFRLYDLDRQDWHLLWAADMKRLTVIGNIYEQPELVNEQTLQLTQEG